MGELTLVVADGVLDDTRTLRETFDAALGARGAVGSVRIVSDLAAGVADAPGDVIVLPPPGATLAEALGALTDGRIVIRFDVADRGPDRSLPVLRHIWGRGTGGVRFAVDAWHFHCALPAKRIPYGSDPEQRAELRVPAGAGPFPVAMLVHGGYWRSRWECDLMDAMAADLHDRGYATWNVEYRRPDTAGWQATADDVAAALDALADVDAPLDLGRVATLGHSAGGQLVVRLAADVAARSDPPVIPALTVSLAGVLDLVAGDERWLGNGAVALALGGHADELPDLYRASSPRHRIPIGLPVATVVGRADDLDLVDATRSFVAAARAAGDDIDAHEGPGGHFGVIDPSSDIWHEVISALAARVPA